jgi:hypothetical protein
MRLATRRVSVALVLCLAFGSAGTAQENRAVGHWVGTLTPKGGTASPFSLTIARDGDRYTGVTSGLSETGEIPVTSLTVNGTNVAFEVTGPSPLGAVSLRGELTIIPLRMNGVATIAVGNQQSTADLALQRRMRRDVAQPQVHQRIDYFAGRWEFDYLGGEFPPLSVGPRTGTATFTLDGTSFVRGELTADLDGKPYREEITIGFNDATKSLTFLERRPDDIELLSVASWDSPIAITFVTSPVRVDGRTWQLRRLLSVTSDAAFSISEEYSVDGGPFRRLGSARFTRAQ